MWAPKQDDDWLVDDATPAKTTPQHVEVYTGASHASVDLTAAVTGEPLHTLPEAPPCTLHVSEGVSYFVVKLSSLKHLSSVQNSGICGLSSYCARDLNMAFAKSTFVVLIFSVIGTFTFDGYAILRSEVGDLSISNFDASGYAPGVKPLPARVQFVRRAVITFDQVSHIRDATGLQGRPVSSAKDGNLLSMAAGRTLCRSIDKRAFKDDPIHYTDDKYITRICPETQSVSAPRPTPEQQIFLSMDYDAYKEWYTSVRTESDPVPTSQYLIV